MNVGFESLPHFSHAKKRARRRAFSISGGESGILQLAFAICRSRLTLFTFNPLAIQRSTGTLHFTLAPFRLRIPATFFSHKKACPQARFSNIWRRVRDFAACFRNLPVSAHSVHLQPARYSAFHRNASLYPRALSASNPCLIFLTQKSAPAGALFNIWRRVRDSNPGSG